MSGVDTLRVSVTDRCNLRCIYCMPPDGIVTKRHDEILRLEEIEKIVRVAAKAGVKKVRLTGGEPLTRKNIEHLVRMISTIDGIKDIALTTNGVLLEDKAEALKAAGLKRVTISIDSLKPDVYKKITGCDELEKALRGIAAARKFGLDPVKINVVPIKGVNDGEAVDFARLAVREKVEVRFIELMPCAANESGALVVSGLSAVSSKDTFEKISAEFAGVVPVESASSGPAKLFALPGGGRIGFISPVTEPFCRACSRMRLTADGKLRACLFGESEIDLMKPLRNGANEDELYEIFVRAVSTKPRREAPCFSGNKRYMVQIGG